MPTITNDRLRALLERELAGISARLPRHRDTSAPQPAGSDFLDVAQSVGHREMESLGVSRLIERARRLRLALERVEGGDYGVCTQCGAVIPPRRLLAVVDATTCVPCQERLERTGAVDVEA
jgi:DnaK suppressor protein